MPQPSPYGKTIRTAKIDNKRRRDFYLGIAGQSRQRYIVDVQCDRCDHRNEDIALAGWDAIVCGKCGCELHKNDAVQKAFEAFELIRLHAPRTKWQSWVTIFSLVDRRQLTMGEVIKLGSWQGFDRAVIEGRREDYLKMQSAK
ncbi:MAG: hypothetical protein GOVbin1773_12 [Prokaryotic dsDNA virus sp.]|nr:MAG: hypothetical protein GOVbin1773_12 [Prokaryotic dsDNA virus sp.]|tara:strand:- start:1604 stop:2032 length:429 start_codon:yes stop_codon:yes gene_type:complete